MKVLTPENLDGFSKALAEDGNLSGATISNLFDLHATEVFLGWTIHDVIDPSCFDFDDYIHSDSETGLLDEEREFIGAFLLSDRSKFDPLGVLKDFQENADCGHESGWFNLTEALHNAYTAEELTAFVVEAITAYSQEKN